MVDTTLQNAKSLLANIRTQLANDSKQQLAQFRGVLDNAHATLDNHVTQAIVNGQGAVNSARKSLDNRINLILGNAMQVSDSFGIAMPSPAELRTRRSFPAAEALSFASGMSASEGQLAAVSGGDGQYRPICLVHNIDASIRQAWVNLCKIAGNLVTVCPEPMQFVSQQPILIRRYPHWWQAELACRLYNECHWPIAEILSYNDAIDATQLWGTGISANMQMFCSVLPDLFEEWRIWNRNQVTRSLQPGEITLPAGVTTLPDGYCWWCDPQGVKHAYYCSPETVPDHWVRC